MGYINLKQKSLINASLFQKLFNLMKAAVLVIPTFMVCNVILQYIAFVIKYKSFF